MKTEQLKKIEKLLKDQKSGFYKFIKKNKGLKHLMRDYIKGDLEYLYDFYISKKDPEWNRRMATSMTTFDMDWNPLVDKKLLNRLNNETNNK